MRKLSDCCFTGFAMPFAACVMTAIEAALGCGMFIFIFIFVFVFDAPVAILALLNSCAPGKSTPTPQNMEEEAAAAAGELAMVGCGACVCIAVPSLRTTIDEDVEADDDFDTTTAATAVSAAAAAARARAPCADHAALPADDRLDPFVELLDVNFTELTLDVFDEARDRLLIEVVLLDLVTIPRPADVDVDIDVDAAKLLDLSPGKFPVGSGARTGVMRLSPTGSMPCRLGSEDKEEADAVTAGVRRL
mmetsp:Transcript_20642/g.58740  ORF Transcript_20642/g.58740 Transcript_20642/m.58740 type:complete len:248 (+) Transcript_20642:703-1446(+)